MPRHQLRKRCSRARAASSKRSRPRANPSDSPEKIASANRMSSHPGPGRTHRMTPPAMRRTPTVTRAIVEAVVFRVLRPPVMGAEPLARTGGDEVSIVGFEGLDERGHAPMCRSRASSDCGSAAGDNARVAPPVGRDYRPRATFDSRSAGLENPRSYPSLSSAPIGRPSTGLPGSMPSSCVTVGWMSTASTRSTLVVAADAVAPGVEDAVHARRVGRVAVARLQRERLASTIVGPVHASQRRNHGNWPRSSIA